MNRHTFMSRVRCFANNKEAHQIEMAYLLAKKSHKGQVRKAEIGPDGKPLRYFEHPRRVALSIIDEAGITEAHVVSAGILHDTYEDDDDIDLMSMLVEEVCGPGTATLVRLVTKVPKEGYIQRLEYAAQDSFSSQAFIIKAADRLDNLRTLPVPLDEKVVDERRRAERRRAGGTHDGVFAIDQEQAKIRAFRDKQFAETRDVLLPLFDLARSSLPSRFMVGYNILVDRVRDRVGLLA